MSLTLLETPKTGFLAIVLKWRSISSYWQTNFQRRTKSVALLIMIYTNVLLFSVLTEFAWRNTQNIPIRNVVRKPLTICYQKNGDKVCLCCWLKDKFSHFFNEVVLIRTHSICSQQNQKNILFFNLKNCTVEKLLV